MATVTDQLPALRPKPAAPVILSFLLVFLGGIAVGAMAMSMGIHDNLHRRPFGSADQKVVTMQRWKQKLDLTDSQSKQVEVILEDFTKYYDNVSADGNSRILQILDEKQKAKFQQILKERR